MSLCLMNVHGDIEGDYEFVCDIPNGTNGEAIISLYPNLKYTIRNGRVITTIGVASSFDLDWWNAPYKAERGE